MSQMKLKNEIFKLIGEYFQTYSAYKFDPKNPTVRLHEPTFNETEICAALDTLLETRITMGPKVLGFEDAYADYVGASNCVMVNSGSSANLLAIAAITNPVFSGHLKPGDEVIVPALCWSTSIWPLVQHGLVPVIVDIEPDTLNIDPKAIEAAISAKTKAIMPIHVYGNPCDMDSIGNLAKAHGLLVVEDTCESMGAKFRGQAVGTFGQIGTFSTYFSHHMTTLEGGLCTTNDHELAELMRILRAHGWIRDMKNPEPLAKEYSEIDRKFLFVNQGYNLRATEFAGAFGLEQIKKLDQMIKVRQDNALYFQKELGKYEDFFSFQVPMTEAESSWFGFPMVLKDNAPFDAPTLLTFLNKRGIETRPIICGNIANQPALELYPHRVAGGLEVADQVMKNGFTFGNHQNIGSDEREFLVQSVRDFIRERVH